MARRTALLDLLTYELPLDEVSSSVWAPLCATGRRNLRASSTLGRQLADSLITSTVVHVAEADAAGAHDCLDGALWQQGLASRCSFLARLPQLTALDIVASTSADLTEILLRAGIATSGRVTALSLYAAGLTMSSTAIGLACPHLQELVLGGDGDSDGGAAGGMYFLPLPSLRKLEVYYSDSLTPDALRSVSCLTGLECLDVAVRQGIPCGVLQEWTRLTRLSHCELWMSSELDSRELCSLADAAPLLQLTQLRHLVLQSLQYSGGADGGAGAATAALSLLSSLVNLESLQLGELFDADAPALAALGCLTRLTALGLGGIRLGQVGQAGQPALVGGHLPALQQLCVRVEQRPSQLLDTLRPLLPLLSLMYLQSAFNSPASVLSLYVGRTVEEEPADEMASAVREFGALRHVATHLAAAPRLLLHVVHVNATGLVAPMLPLAQVAEGLQPLGARITSFTFMGRDALPSGNAWWRLGVLMPRLLSLRLEGCILEDRELSSLVRHLTALQRLSLSECTGVTRTDWVEMAAAVVRPLVLFVDPPMSAEVEARCVAQTQGVDGSSLLTIE